MVEDSLTELIGEMLSAGRIRFGTDNAAAAGSADFVFLCLPTPADADGSADVSLVLAVAAEIGPRLRPGTTVITKSTVPVGTADQVRRALARSDVHVAANPEFLAEGSAVRDCLFPDRIALVHTAGEFGCSLELVEAAIASNAHHIQRIIGKVAMAVGDVRGRRIALLGLTFKAGTSDLRNSPAMAIAEGLRALGASVQAYDPTVHPGAVTGIETHGSLVSACRDAEALVIGTEWPEFAALDLPVLRAVMSGRFIVDARNLLDPAAAARAGFAYTGIGIPMAGELAAQMAT